MKAFLATLLGLSLYANNALGQSTPAAASPVVADVLRLSHAKVEENIIISFIHNTPGVHLTASEIIDLRAQGLSSGILVALMNAQPGSPEAALPPASAPATAKAEPVPAAPAQTELVAAAPSYTSDPVVLAAPEPVYYDFSAPYYPYSYYPYYGDPYFGLGLGWGLGLGFTGGWGWGGW